MILKCYRLCNTYEAGILTIYYPYFVEEENHTYELTTVIDSVNQTITTRDPGFYWAYAYSTETNYGRNIEYMDETYPGYSYESPETGLVYDLGKYNLQIVDKAGEFYYHLALLTNYSLVQVTITYFIMAIN